MLLTLLTAVYALSAMLLTLYAVGAVILLIMYLRHRHENPPTPQVTDWPTVAIQLPIFNERYVVGRLLEAVNRLDYPRDRITVQVLDDSTDETSDIVALLVDELRKDGLNIVHVRRESRTGYKAGALAYGLSLLNVEMVAVLDADFVPPPDFLRLMIPHLATDPKLGMVQGRWGHLNAYGNLLTLGQTLALDGHFVVEQMARNRSGWLMNFNGSGGVWRVKAIQEAGGWRDSTLTEDLDLSYRAQIKGWKFLYLPEVVVPGELPPQIAAYKQQQARWAKGGAQCLTQLIAPIWAADLTLMQRLMATMHLCQYMIHPVIILLLILTPPLLILHAVQNLQLGTLGLAGLGPPLIYVFSQQALYPDWRRRLLALPAVLALGTGLALSNSRAVISGLMGQEEEFRRTPKFVRGWQSSNYALRGRQASYWELALAIYAAFGACVAVFAAPPLIPYLMLYSFAFGTVSIWGLYDDWAMRRAEAHAS